MKQVVLNIPDNKFNFFMELLKSFRYVKIEKFTGKSDEEIIEGIKTGLNEIKLIEKGKLKSTPLNEFLDEL